MENSTNSFHNFIPSLYPKKLNFKTQSSVLIHFQVELTRSVTMTSWNFETIFAAFFLPYFNQQLNVNFTFLQRYIQHKNITITQSNHEKFSATIQNKNNRSATLPFDYISYKDLHVIIDTFCLSCQLPRCSFASKFSFRLTLTSQILNQIEKILTAEKHNYNQAHPS